MHRLAFKTVRPWLRRALSTAAAIIMLSTAPAAPCAAHAWPCPLIPDGLYASIRALTCDLARGMNRLYGICLSDEVTPLGDVSKGEFPITLLVNRDSMISGELKPRLAGIGDGKYVDARCYDNLQRMLADCRAEGLSPVVRSAYRSYDRQVRLFKNKVRRQRKKGLDEAEAHDTAMMEVALPGASEHQLGLAMDIVDRRYQELETPQEDTAVQKWLMANSYRYGFVLRYPADKCKLTGIIYEPWHYRYVGRKAALIMHENDMCLEEYAAYLKKQG